MGDSKHHGAPRSEERELEVTDEWRLRVRDALAAHRKQNREAGLRPRDPSRLVDDHASLERAIKMPEGAGGVAKILGRALPTSRGSQQRKLVQRSTWVIPISRVLRIGLPTSDDEFWAAVAAWSPSMRSIVTALAGDPEFEKVISELHSRKTRRTPKR